MSVRAVATGAGVASDSSTSPARKAAACAAPITTTTAPCTVSICSRMRRAMCASRVLCQPRRSRMLSA
jgi:hypothetical protein